MTTDLTTLRSSVLGISAEASVEQIADVLGRVEIATKALKEIKALAEERIIERIREQGPFTVNEIRYFIGPKKTTKCIDPIGTADAILQAIGGDLEQFVAVLAAQPYKHGAVKALIGEERWSRLFKVSEEVDLKTGAPIRELCAVNEKYLPSRKTA